MNRNVNCGALYLRYTNKRKRLFTLSSYIHQKTVYADSALLKRPFSIGANDYEKAFGSLHIF